MAATFGDAVADVVALAKSESIPIVIERLDFEAKKARLRGESERMARMLSSCARRRFDGFILSRAAR